MQHIYLSEQSVLASPKTEDKFRYRGEPTGPNDDPQGFKRRMARTGYEVIITAEVIGSATPATKGVILATRAQLGG